MTRKDFLRLSALGAASALCRRSYARDPAPSPLRPAILSPDSFAHHVKFFNGMVPEETAAYIPNDRAWDWMKENIPLFTCPDEHVEQTYFYRWWAYRKAIKQVPSGDFLISEFLKPVKHAGPYNSLSCAFGHHVHEGRWIHDRRYIDGDIHYWLKAGPEGVEGLAPNFHQFSGWAAATLYERWLVDANTDFLTSYIEALILDYRTWEEDRLLDNGLFWQRDVADGMEVSVSGGRKVKNIRPTINSYMYGNARAIAEIAVMAGRDPIAKEYHAKADKLKHLVQEHLWNADAAFFETVLESGKFADVREAIGFTPWYFNLPDDRESYAVAWKQLMDPRGFYAPFGITTAEQRSPGFEILYQGDDCQWNGPSWAFATTVTLKALANLLNGYRQQAISRSDYFDQFQIYTQSQRLKLPDGQVIPWIDEDVNPYTGEWIARTMKIRKGVFYGRGDHYNHSGYADLLITGLVGLRPRPDKVVEVNPSVPPGKWSWFCLDNVAYHGRSLTILWDESGTKFGKGKGLSLFANGRPIGNAAALTRVTAELS